MNSNKFHKYFTDVRWGDMDLMMHVNNVSYLSYFESARVGFFMDTGIRIDGKTDGPVLLKTECMYLQPIHYPARVCVETRISHIGNTSYTISQQLYNTDGHRLCTKALFTMVWTDGEKQRPLAIPDSMREKLNQFLSIQN
ncbi:MAG: thioesterase family protein [Pseudomonadales bacterium]